MTNVGDTILLHVNNGRWVLAATGPYGQFTICELAKKWMHREDYKNLVCTLIFL